MNILILGKGGREQAIAKALKQSPLVKNILVAPGGDGFPDKTINLPAYPWTKPKAKEWINKHKIGLVVVGPEKELSLGAGDFFRALKLPVFGPSQSATRLESSKLFAKKFMQAYNIPTSAFKEVGSTKEALEASPPFGYPLVLKADGLAGGKGVFICHHLKELEEKAKQIFENKRFGKAGDRALIEQFQQGQEMSVFVLLASDSKGSALSSEVLPFAKDYKKLKDGDLGPNTGGMGALAPRDCPLLLKNNIMSKVVRPTLLAIEKEKLFYRGVLYIGLMILKNQEPIVLEYNVRFGDPETQVLLPLLEGDLAKVFLSVAEGKVPALKWREDLFSACVVLASPGYPEKPSPALPIEGRIEHKTQHSYFLHAGTLKKGDTWFTNGGRVLNAIGLGSTQEEALSRADALAEQVHWPGLQKRSL